MTTRPRVRPDSSEEAKALGADITPEMDKIHQDWCRRRAIERGVPMETVDRVWGPKDA